MLLNRHIFPFESETSKYHYPRTLLVSVFLGPRTLATYGSGWVDGVLKHSLHHEVLISLGKRPMDKAVDAPWKYTVEVADAANSAPLDDRDVSAIYDATGLVLILGEPGSGKTTTLLDLARALHLRPPDAARLLRRLDSPIHEN